MPIKKSTTKKTATRKPATTKRTAVKNVVVIESDITTQQPITESITKEQVMTERKADEAEMLALFKIANKKKEQMDRILYFYNKYVDNTTKNYTTDCSNCRNSIVTIYKNLRDWYHINKIQFEL